MCVTQTEAIAISGGNPDYYIVLRRGDGEWDRYSVSPMRGVEKGGRKGFCEARLSAYSTRVNAGIAQLVEQLICNQQVVGSNPTAGSLIILRGFEIRRNFAWTLLLHDRGCRAA